MINNRVTPNRRSILSAINLYFFQQKRNENIESYNSVDNDNLDTALLNEENKSYIPGYN
jgi:hypothetical protein